MDNRGLGRWINKGKCEIVVVRRRLKMESTRHNVLFNNEGKIARQVVFSLIVLPLFGKGRTEHSVPLEAVIVESEGTEEALLVVPDMYGHATHSLASTFFSTRHFANAAEDLASLPASEMLSAKSA